MELFELDLLLEYEEDDVEALDDVEVLELVDCSGSSSASEELSTHPNSERAKATDTIETAIVRNTFIVRISFLTGCSMGTSYIDNSGIC